MYSMNKLTGRFPFVSGRGVSWLGFPCRRHHCPNQKKRRQKCQLTPRVFSTPVNGLFPEASAGGGCAHSRRDARTLQSGRRLAVARRGEWSGARRGRALKWAPNVNKKQGHGGVTPSDVTTGVWRHRGEVRRRRTSPRLQVRSGRVALSCRPLNSE